MKKSPSLRCVPSRLDPLFGGWTVRDTVTKLHLNQFGIVTDRNCDSFDTKAEAAIVAAEWNTLLTECPRIVDVFRLWRARQQRALRKVGAA